MSRVYEIMNDANEYHKFLNKWEQEKLFSDLCSKRKYLKVDANQFFKYEGLIKFNLRYSVVKKLQKRQNAFLVLLVILIMRKLSKRNFLFKSEFSHFGISNFRLEHGLRDLKKLGIVSCEGHKWMITKTVVKNNGSISNVLKIKSINQIFQALYNGITGLIALNRFNFFVGKQKKNKIVNLTISNVGFGINDYKINDFITVLNLSLLTQLRKLTIFIERKYDRAKKSFVSVRHIQIYQAKF
ncbi:hypothetical protein [[Mycoplasma] anseris]|uniref:Uncharacterized protein n=1 Tax=[Mycoplasma] anseris TaxID=92400 RepID=A0A2Z4NCY5_9BACT|nr:hypothetical protein [[Mycoplasma] anseris]AWX69409.1 hypothetical protein DP065_01405 [[Mycoplasma] anseris]